MFDKVSSLETDIFDVSTRRLFFHIRFRKSNIRFAGGYRHGVSDGEHFDVRGGEDLQDDELGVHCLCGCVRLDMNAGLSGILMGSETVKSI